MPNTNTIPSSYISMVSDLTTFYKGFNSFEKMNVSEDMIVYTTPRPFKACDDARIRIAELGLPLTAKVTNSITFIVEPCK